MTAERPKGPQFGASAEHLAQFVIGTFAFITPVPYQMDIGVDFHCVLHRKATRASMVRGGATFTVQVKSTPDPVAYESEAAQEWISSQPNPLFICIVDRASGICEIYSTWNMRNGHLLHGPVPTFLHPGKELEDFDRPALVDGQLHVPMGPPVLRLTPGDVMDRDRAIEWADLLEPWIELDRRNIINSGAAMYWVEGPRWWETNQPLATDQEGFGAFFWNRRNLPDCLRNFTRSAVALRRVIDKCEAEGWPVPSTYIDSVDSALRAHREDLDPLAQRVLEKRDVELGLVQQRPPHGDIGAPIVTPEVE